MNMEKVIIDGIIEGLKNDPEFIESVAKSITNSAKEDIKEKAHIVKENIVNNVSEAKEKVSKTIKEQVVKESPHLNINHPKEIKLSKSSIMNYLGATFIKVKLAKTNLNHRYFTYSPFEDLLNHLTGQENNKYEIYAIVPARQVLSQDELGLLKDGYHLFANVLHNNEYHVVKILADIYEEVDEDDDTVIYNVDEENLSELLSTLNRELTEKYVLVQLQ